MRVSSLVAVVLLASGCSSSGSHSTASEPAKVSARIDACLAANEADRVARAAAAREAVTSYVAKHPGPLEPTREALLADRLAVGMSPEAIALVFPGRDLVIRPAMNVVELALVVETDEGKDVVRFVDVNREVFLGSAGVATEREALLVMKNGSLVSWSGDGKGGPR